MPRPDCGCGMGDECQYDDFMRRLPCEEDFYDVSWEAQQARRAGEYVPPVNNGAS